MKIKSCEHATVRTVYHKEKRFQTLQFNNFDEALKQLKTGDEVLVFENCGRYLMKVYHIKEDYIMCGDDVTTVFIQRENEWIKNELEQVI